jgi:GT2 family glycosyltransferase
MNGISVIIVSWNAQKYLRDCLASLRATRGTSVREIIVVDNDSHDGSPEMVAEEFTEVTLIRTGENLGFARANNLAIQKASGSWLALINSDVVVHPGCLQALAGFLESHSEAALVGPKVIGGDGHLQRTCRLLPGVWNMACQAFGLDRLLPKWRLFSGREMRHWDQNDLTEVEVLSGCFWMARREAVAEIGGLDERFFFYAEDVDWCKRFRDGGWKVFFVPQAVATHFGGGSSANAPLAYCIQMLRANLDYWRKHHGKAGQRIYRALSVVHFGVRVIPLGILRMAGAAKAGVIGQKFQENFVSLRWLLTGRGV